VVNRNVGFDDLAAARIDDVRAIRIFNSGREPADDRVARVFRIPPRILLGVGPSLAMIAFLKPAASKAGCQSVIAFRIPRLQLVRSRRVDVKDIGLSVPTVPRRIFFSTLNRVCNSSAVRAVRHAIVYLLYREEAYASSYRRASSAFLAA